MKDLERSH